jgi:hypothetical protein
MWASHIGVHRWQQASFSCKFLSFDLCLAPLNKLNLKFNGTGQKENNFNHSAKNVNPKS